MNDLKTRIEDTEEKGEQIVLAIAAAAALGGLGFWLYRRSQKPNTALTMMDTAQLAQLPAPEEEVIRLARLGEEEEVIRLAQLEEEEDIHLARLPSERDKRRQGGGITIL